MTDKVLQELLDKQAINEVLLNYAHGIDHQDEDRLRSVFHPESEHNHGFVGPSSTPDKPSTNGDPNDFVGFALSYMKGFVNSHHQLGTPLVELHGNLARSECYFTATQRMRAKGDPLAPAMAQDTEMQISMGGRYLDELEKRDGVWKIINRTGVLDWQRSLPAADRPA
ncbi:MAG: nuclear transport factor 2 family protein [Pseudomonadales bacterium]